MSAIAIERITVDGKEHSVENVRELGEITPQLAAHMTARGFNAYGYVKLAGGEAVVYRATKLGTWHIVQRVRA